MNIAKFDKVNVNRLFNYWNEISKEIPYFFNVDFNQWVQCLFEDEIEGEKIFKYLEGYFFEENNKVIGFIQFGQPNYYYNAGIKTYVNNIGAIRNIFYDKNRIDVGKILIEKAEEYFKNNNFETCFAFNHVIGMSCNVYHGKLHNSMIHVEKLLLDYGYSIEHENIYYSIDLPQLVSNNVDAEIYVKPEEFNEYNNQYARVFFKDVEIGGYKILYFQDLKLAYLKTIWISNDYAGQGIGTIIMKMLLKTLYEQGYLRLDLDTASNNIIGQKYYDKNGFMNKGFTRSYIREN